MRGMGGVLNSETGVLRMFPFIHGRSITVLWLVVALCFAQCHAFGLSRSHQSSIVLRGCSITVSLAQDNEGQRTSIEKTTQRDIVARNRGREFVASIMKDMEEIPGSNGMKVMRGVVKLESDNERNICIRNITQHFWEECIKEITRQDARVRVCAVGTPGIGKTTSTPFLIRMLLEEKATVVYRLASADYFWEFKWNNEEGYVVSVYPKESLLREIESLNNESTFYIVDPGLSSDNCLPNTSFKARTIIVSSPDEKHWGGKEFTKDRDDVIGRFRYFPMWDLDELLMARPYLSSTVLTVEKLEARFRLFGGVPRHIFAKDEDVETLLRNQNASVEVLTARQARQIVEGKLDAVGSFGSNQPRSAIIGYAKVKAPEKIPFSSPQIEIVSIAAEEKIVKGFMSDLWNLMLQDEIAGWRTFETYCRILMSASASNYFLGRPCCGKKDKEYKLEYTLTLGGCKTVRLVSDIAREVILGKPMTIFHSINPSQPLCDFIYKDKNGTVHAFQVTKGKTHKIQTKLIKKLRETLGNSRLVLYYLIPSDNFMSFVTKPLKPKTDELTSVRHILIPNPNVKLHHHIYHTSISSFCV